MYALAQKMGILIIWAFLCITSGWVTECADIDNYKTYYDNPTIAESYVSNLSNPGFYYIYTLFQSLGCSFETYHILFFVAVMTFIVWFVSAYSKRPVIVLLLYIIVAFFGDIIQMKNTLAMVVLYIALLGIIDKTRNHKKLITAIILLLAATIHVGFLAYLVLLLYGMRINSKIYILFMMALSLAGHSILQAFSQYASLLDATTIAGKAENYMSNGSIFSVLACSFVYLVHYFTCKRFLKWNDRSAIYVDRLMNINVLLSVVIIFSSINMTFFRLFRNIILFNSVFLINGYIRSKRTPTDLIVMMFYFFVMSYFYLFSGAVWENVASIFNSNSLI